MGSALDDTRFYLYAVPTPEVSLPQLDAAVDRVLAKFMADGIDAEALERAKTRLVADAIYAQDSQATLARWYGASLATGRTIMDVQEWPARIEAVTAEAVLTAARKWLVPRRAVTGYLLPAEGVAA
jgi:zinc protease